MAPSGTTIEIDGEKLRAERKARKLTQKALADLVADYTSTSNISANDISRYERNKQNPTAERLEQICVALSKTLLPSTHRCKTIHPTDLQQQRQNRQSPCDNGVLNRLSRLYQNVLDRFFEEYEPSPEQPIPFGGRDKELQKLDDWLNESESPPYLFLTAPAGRGKSALLVHWREQLLEETTNWKIIFFPISIRHGTNRPGVFFKAITMQLYAILGGAPPTCDMDEDAWKEEMTRQLAKPLPKNKHLLLIMDGLDEMAGDPWHAGLFPRKPPKRLRIVVSARHLANTSPREWICNKLGWPSGSVQIMELANLNKEGLRDALKSMGDQMNSLLDRSEIIDQLYRLTDSGDPLLVRLYADELWNRPDSYQSPEQLKNIKPGLEGFFDRWWEEQKRLWDKQNNNPLKEKSVQTVLNLLALAKGPLHKDDLTGLSAHSPNSLGIKLSTWDLESVISDILRFVIGDGEQQGYSFAHPRLGLYFEEKLSVEERIEWNDCFVRWGKHTLYEMKDGSSPTQPTSEYLIHYHSAHLEKSNNATIEDYLDLVSNEWSTAWHSLTGDFEGFIRDVKSAWRNIEESNQKEISEGKEPRNIGNEVLCALCLASIHSISSKLLLEYQVEKWSWNPARMLAYANQIPNDKQRAEILIQITQRLSDEDEELKTTAEEVFRIIAEIDDEHSKFVLLKKGFCIFPPESLIKSLNEIKGFNQEWRKASILAKMSTYLKDENLLKEALHISRGLSDSENRAQALVSLAKRVKGFWNKEILKEAIDEAFRIDNPIFKVQFLSNLDASIPPYYKNKATSLAESIDGDPILRAKSLANISLCYKRRPLNILKDMENSIREITDKEDKDKLEKQLDELRQKPWESMVLHHGDNESHETHYKNTTSRQHFEENAYPSIEDDRIGTIADLAEFANEHEFHRWEELEIFLKNAINNSLSPRSIEPICRIIQCFPEEKRLELFNYVDKYKIELEKTADYAFIVTILEDYRKPASKRINIQVNEECPSLDSYENWKKNLHEIIEERRERKELFFLLRENGQTIRSLGGSSAVKDTINAIIKVATWWP